MKDPVIEVRDFRKIYGDFVAVDGISFDVQGGEIFGLLGPNGAGKTSTLSAVEVLRTGPSAPLVIQYGRVAVSTQTSFEGDAYAD